MLLVRLETSPEDLRGMIAAEGILTARGGLSSHAALVARQMGKVCVCGVSEMEIDYNDRTGEKPIPWTLGYFNDGNRKALYNNLSKIISFRTDNPEIFSSDSGDTERKTWKVGGGNMGSKTLVLSNSHGGVIVVANQNVTGNSSTTVSVPQTGEWTNIITGEKVNLSSSYNVTLKPHEFIVLGKVN